MSRTVFIGSMSLNVVLSHAGATLGAMPGGAIALAAACAAGVRRDASVLMCGDVGADLPGTLVRDFLEQAGVDIRGVDTFTEGRTPVNFFMEGSTAVSRYDLYPADSFDIVWPRIDRGDTVVFGGHYALDRRMRPRIVKLLDYARSVGAFLVYVPDYTAGVQQRITRVMPSILENLEMANLVVASVADLEAIFDTPDPVVAYAERIRFYGPDFICTGNPGGQVRAYIGADIISSPGMGTAGAASMLLGGTFAGSLVAAPALADIRGMGPEAQQRMLESAAAAAAAAVGSLGQSQAWRLVPR